jgi:hypothetical protein
MELQSPQEVTDKRYQMELQSPQDATDTIYHMELQSPQEVTDTLYHMGYSMFYHYHLKQVTSLTKIHLF